MMDAYGFEGRDHQQPGDCFGLFQEAGAAPPAGSAAPKFELRAGLSWKLASLNSGNEAFTADLGVASPTHYAYSDGKGWGGALGASRIFSFKDDKLRLLVGGTLSGSQFDWQLSTSQQRPAQSQATQLNLEVMPEVAVQFPVEGDKLTALEVGVSYAVGATRVTALAEPRSQTKGVLVTGYPRDLELTQYPAVQGFNDWAIQHGPAAWVGATFARYVGIRTLVRQRFTGSVDKDYPVNNDRTVSINLPDNLEFTLLGFLKVEL